LTSEAYGGQPRTTAGGIIIVAISLLAALLVTAGLIYAAGTSERHKVALAAAGCEPGLSPSGLQCTTAQMLTSQYMAIMTPANQQLLTDEAAYTAAERNNLTAAKAALAAEVTSEHAFDANLAGVKFPAAIAPIAKALIEPGPRQADHPAGRSGHPRQPAVVQPPAPGGQRRRPDRDDGHPQSADQRLAQDGISRSTASIRCCIRLIPRSHLSVSLARSS
jgi:hypothetical protein